MKYYGSFYSIHKNKNYRVEIVTNNDSTLTHELNLSSSPFVTEMDSNSSTIFSPVKYSSATVGIVDTAYQFDLYSSTAKQNSVKLFDSSNNIIWTGYTRPTLYSASFNRNMEEYSIECLDGLSILQYYDYETVGQTKSFASFTQIINKILSKAGCYTDWYFSANTSVYNVTGKLPDLCTMSEQNWFDEDDEPTKMNIVLEEVCKFCGVTAVAYGSSVYFLDYDAIKNGVNTYYHYRVGNNTALSNVTVSDNKTLSKNDFASADSTIELCQTYSKVSIKDSLYSVDTIFPSLFEDENLKNIKGYPWSADTDNWHDGFSGTVTNHYIADSNKVWNSKYIFNGFWERFYVNKKFTHHFYNSSGTEVTPSYTGSQHVTNSAWFYGDYADYTVPTMINNNVGALFVKIDMMNTSGSGEQDTARNYMFKERGEHTSHSWTDYLLLHLNDNVSTSHKLLEAKSSVATKPFFMSSTGKILITGNIQCDDRVNCPIPLNNYEEKQDSTSLYNLSIPAQLKVGDYYYNNSSTQTLGWQTTPCTFNIRFGESGDIWGNVDHFNGQEFPIADTTTLDSNAPSQGTMISLPQISGANCVPQTIEFSLWSRGRINGDYRLDRVWLKDFDIQVFQPYEGPTDENDTDTEYTYDIDTEYVNELDDIDFTVCTWDGKQCNYSSVAYYKNGKYNFVDKLSNSARGLNERAENQLAYKIIQQYKQPAKKETANLFNDIKPFTKVYNSILDATMIVDSVRHDYQNDSAEYTLVEKF